MECGEVYAKQACNGYAGSGSLHDREDIVLGVNYVSYKCLRDRNSCRARAQRRVAGKAGGARRGGPKSGVRRTQERGVAGHGVGASRDVACSQAVTVRQPDIQRVLAA